MERFALGVEGGARQRVARQDLGEDGDIVFAGYDDVGCRSVIVRAIDVLEAWATAPAF